MTALGRLDLATKAYRQWLAVDPESPTAQHLLAGCTGLDVPGRAANGFIVEEFHEFADSFDENMAALDYRAPRLIESALDEAGLPRRGHLHVLDAGCGTGLCGHLLRPWSKRLVGVDLSPRMLERAERRGEYDELVLGELTEYLDRSRASFDLIVAADTLVYFGDLGSAFDAAADAIRNPGYFVFTVEHEPTASAPSDGFRLHPHGRYGHTADYVSTTLAQAGFEVVRLHTAILRREGHFEVDGLVVVACRRG